MTRDEAKENLYALIEGCGQEGNPFVEAYNVENLIDAIYDNIEARSCQTCKYSKIEEIQDDYPDIICTNKDSLLCDESVVDNGVDDKKMFACKFWEAKQ